MSYYIRISAVQEPFPFGSEAQRQFSCNFDIEALDLDPAWEKELASRLIGLGLGTYGSDLFIGTDYVQPATGIHVSLINTGGTGPTETHDEVRTSRPSLQVIVSGDGNGAGSDYFAVKARATDIYSALHGTRNTTITNTAGL